MSDTEKTGFDPDTDLELDGRAFTRNVLRVLLHVLDRMKAEGHKSWKHQDFVQLIETMLEELAPKAAEAEVAETAGGEGEELPAGHDRGSCIIAGKTAFEKGMPRNSNPHGEGTELRRWWDIGWHDAERAKKVAGGGTVSIQTGRRAELQLVEGGYRIQRKEDSIVTEWDDILHQYAKDGQGSVYSDYDEALAMAEKLRAGTTGIVKVISVKE